MMCQRIGRPPTSTSGFGSTLVSCPRRVPRPPQRMTTSGPAEDTLLFAMEAPRPAPIPHTCDDGHDLDDMAPRPSKSDAKEGEVTTTSECKGLLHHGSRR